MYKERIIINTARGYHYVTALVSRKTMTAIYNNKTYKIDGLFDRITNFWAAI